jgi:adenylate cyclase
VGFVLALLSLLPLWRPFEFGAYDLFLKLKPEVKESRSVVLLDVDEEAIVRSGSWPWPRGFVAKGLETLSEIGANYAVFDIEYNERSPMSVDRDYLNVGLKTVFDNFFDDVGSNVGQLFASIANGSVSLRDAKDYGGQLVDLIGQGKRELYDKTSRVAVENDSYLGRAMRLFGHAFVTLNLQKVKLNPPLASRALAAERFPYAKVTATAPIGTTDLDYISPITEVTSMASSAGFTNVTIDPDGVRRRIRLVEEIDGKYYLQLAFSPLIRMLGEPEIVVRGTSVLLKGALYDGVRTDVSIPLDPDGNMLLRWPKKTYSGSFAPHVSFYRLLEYRANEDQLVQNLRSLGGMEVWALIPGANPVVDLLTIWDAGEEARLKALDSGKAEDRTAWLETKKKFKEAVASFLAAGYDKTIVSLLAEAKAGAPAKDASAYDGFAKRFSDLYSNSAAASDLVNTEEAALRARLGGAYCIIGWTATATTDIGANPFDPRYVNVGTHAAIANQILQRDFLYEAPRWVGSLLALLLAFGVVILASRFSTVGQIIVGLGATAFVFVGSYALFHFWSIHIPVLAPTLATFLSFLGYALVSFILESREKAVLRKGFNTYLSEDVVNQIVADPSVLKLGGDKTWITAVFTDVRGFSTISEALDPVGLVKLLNLYLSGMSDILLQNRGTIDKYEGDAIISFFGAPLHFDTHAKAACLSAVMMRRREAELNVQFMADKLSPTPLLTRFGINTGDMVVGNMGTEKKMNYTIMGNAVNLAARLEGVNKQYGSWILVSDDTKKEAGDEFVTRRFDQVRVVGINTPVQLWEIVDLKADVDAAQLDFLDRWEKAHAVYDGRDWKKAAELFATLCEERPKDGPSVAYRKRAETFFAKPPAPDWDGVVNLTEK